MTSNWDKFLLLLWKNWIIQKRHYIQTVFEILIPALCCSMLILVRGLVDPEQIEKPTIFSPLEANTFGSIKYTCVNQLRSLNYESNPLTATWFHQFYQGLHTHPKMMFWMQSCGMPWRIIFSAQPIFPTRLTRMPGSWKAP